MTLINLGNVIIEQINGNDIVGKPNFDGDFKKTKYKLTWLSKCDAIDLVVHEYDHILKTPKLVITENKTIDPACINMDSHKIMYCYGDSALEYISNSTTIQFVRRGYYIMDKSLELIKLPETKFNHLSMHKNIEQ